MTEVNKIVLEQQNYTNNFQTVFPSCEFEFVDIDILEYRLREVSKLHFPNPKQVIIFPGFN